MKKVVIALSIISIAQVALPMQIDKQFELNSKLDKAVQQSNWPEAKKLIAEGADINYVLDRFIEAAREGNLTKIQSLVKLGANINAQDEYGRTALRYAASFGHLDIVQYLVQHKADVNIPDKILGNTPLIGAVYEYFGVKPATTLAIVKTLVQNGADMDIKSRRFDKTALMYAAYNGDYDVVKYLIEQGADVNALEKGQYTALINAAFKGNFDIVRLLSYFTSSKPTQEQIAKIKSQEIKNWLLNPPTYTRKDRETFSDIEVQRRRNKASKDVLFSKIPSAAAFPDIQVK